MSTGSRLLLVVLALPGFAPWFLRYFGKQLVSGDGAFAGVELVPYFLGAMAVSLACGLVALFLDAPRNARVTIFLVDFSHLVLLLPPFHA
ncbi:MAG: hypothetical protein ACYTHK_05675 [Planctomycetota bacterium]